MFEKLVVVDCRSHLLGRLAATVAKELLNGQKIALVRCEEMNISGSLYRNKLKYLSFLRKRSNSNPRRSSHIHHRTPAMIVWRTIRGMLPHKTARGAAALARLAVFEGIPESLETHKRVVIPNALRSTCLKRGRHYCRLGDLAERVGWKHGDVLKRLEARRKVRSAAYYETKRAEQQALDEARKAATSKLSKEHQQLLASAGLA